MDLACYESGIDAPAVDDPGGGAPAVGDPGGGAAALGDPGGGAVALGDPDRSGFNFAGMASQGELTRADLFSKYNSVDPNEWPLDTNFVEMLRLSGIEDVEKETEETSGSYNIIKMRKCKIGGEEKRVIFRHPKMTTNNYLATRVFPEGSEVLSDGEKSILRGEVLNKEFWRTCSVKGIIPEVYCHILFKDKVHDNRLTTCMVSEMYDSDLWNYYTGRGGTAQDHAGVDKDIAEQLYSLLDDLLELNYWCVDLKPQNCVINLREGKPIVRLTDVDSGEGANEFCGKKEESIYGRSDDLFKKSLGLLIKLILTIVFIVQLPVNIFSYLDPPNSELFEDGFLVSCRLICLCNYTKYYEDPLIAGISAQMSLMIDAYMKPIRHAMRYHIAPSVAGDLRDDMNRASHIINAGDGSGKQYKLISPMFFNVMWAIAKNGGEQIWEDVMNDKMTEAEENKIIEVVGKGLDASVSQMDDQKLGIFDGYACDMLDQPLQQGSQKKRKPAKKFGAGYLKSSKKRRTKKRRTKKRRTKKRRTKKRRKTKRPKKE
jgi:hypothetical protein